MNTKFNCPVCGYQEVLGNICPNCDADLAVMRMLQELPRVENSRPFAAWPLGIALFILIIGIGLGVGGSFVFFQPRVNTIVISPPIPPFVANSQPKPVIKQIKPTTYTVKSGEYLSEIADKLCGQGTSWQVLVDANPKLKGRENYLIVGEVLKIPNCQEGL